VSPQTRGKAPRSNVKTRFNKKLALIPLDILVLIDTKALYLQCEAKKQSEAEQISDT
jgi:hypothetical protein